MRPAPGLDELGGRIHFQEVSALPHVQRFTKIAMARFEPLDETAEGWIRYKAMEGGLITIDTGRPINIDAGKHVYFQGQVVHLPD